MFLVWSFKSDIQVITEKAGRHLDASRVMFSPSPVGAECCLRPGLYTWTLLLQSWFKIMCKVHGLKRILAWFNFSHWLYLNFSPKLENSIVLCIWFDWMKRSQSDTVSYLMACCRSTLFHLLVAEIEILQRNIETGPWVKLSQPSNC